MRRAPPLTPHRFQIPGAWVLAVHTPCRHVVVLGVVLGKTARLRAATIDTRPLHADANAAPHPALRAKGCSVRLRIEGLARQGTDAANDEHRGCVDDRHLHPTVPLTRQ